MNLSDSSASSYMSRLHELKRADQTQVLPKQSIWGENRLMLAGTAARLFPVGGFSVSGTHELRFCGQPLRIR